MEIQSEVFLRDDLAAILKALALAGNNAPFVVATPEQEAYQDGFQTALSAVALALHIDIEIEE